MSESLAPALIYAVPQLLDPNFHQSVVLLLQQNEQGAFGVVINHESGLLLEDLCRGHNIPYAGEQGKKVRRGGPVQPEQGLVLYGDELTDPEGQSVVDGLQVSFSKETLGRLCRLQHGRFHCYAGYAGWAPGQLTHEIEEGSWIFGPVDPTLALDVPPEEMWAHGLRALGIEPAAIVPGGTVEA
ncbi:MAG TPA: YqgE/AlgH family protein [Candidatus Polarisedimenticolia bacterium]|nr:YqgE/AlgH family protein [Candidatus Polarisedimenticolia bacterium]